MLSFRESLQVSLDLCDWSNSSVNIQFNNYLQELKRHKVDQEHLYAVPSFQTLVISANLAPNF